MNLCNIHIVKGVKMSTNAKMPRELKRFIGAMLLIIVVIAAAAAVVALVFG